MKIHPTGNLYLFAILLTTMLAIAGCESMPTRGAIAVVPKAEIQFIDFQGFDKDIAAALAAPLPTVNVGFHDKVTVSALPSRVQAWIAAIDAGNGAVTVVHPKPSVTSKSPILLMGLISSLWTASQTAKEMAAKAQYNAAHSYDANIVLKLDDKGESVVDKVVFVLRKK